jgi:hypothetical protein
MTFTWRCLMIPIQGGDRAIAYWITTMLIAGEYVVKRAWMNRDAARFL